MTDPNAGMAGGRPDENPKAKGNNLRKHLDAARCKTTQNQNPEESQEIKFDPSLEHDPELDTVRGLNEKERDELMSIFKRKERSTL